MHKSNACRHASCSSGAVCRGSSAPDRRSVSDVWCGFVLSLVCPDSSRNCSTDWLYWRLEYLKLGVRQRMTKPQLPFPGPPGRRNLRPDTTQAAHHCNGTSPCPTCSSRQQQSSCRLREHLRLQSCPQLQQQALWPAGGRQGRQSSSSSRSRLGCAISRWGACTCPTQTCTPSRRRRCVRAFVRGLGAACSCRSMPRMLQAFP